jgi:hypothetical protein
MAELDKFSQEIKECIVLFLDGQSKAVTHAFESNMPKAQAYKARSDRLRALLAKESCSNDFAASSGHYRAIKFWKVMRICLSEKEYQYFKKWNCNRLGVKKRAYCSVMYGLTRNGFKTVVADRNKFVFNSELVRQSPDYRLRFIPTASRRAMSKPSLEKLQALEEKLVMHFETMRLRGGVGYTSDARDSNRGKSLARTVVSGGQYANKSSNISGSVHLNSNLKSVPLLQEEVNTVVTQIIIDVYGTLPWFRLLMFLLKDIPAERFIGDEALLPCSHIWWTRDPKSFHVHCDNNTTGAAFVFCANTASGGSLVGQRSDGTLHKTHLEEGLILGGAWAQYAHFNEPTEVQRRSFVVYLDYRVLSSSYVSKWDNV